LANAETNWTVTANPTNYTPPNRSDFTFGTWIPWWRNYGGDVYESEISYRGGGRPYGGGTSQTFKGVTDASGKHLLKIDFESVKSAASLFGHGFGFRAGRESANVVEFDCAARSSVGALRRHPNAAHVCAKRRKYRSRINRFGY
jgi:hypothetical protein